MSKHVAEVVEINLEKHPNADALSIVRIGDFQVVVNTAMWDGIDKGVYILPDTIVDVTRPEFNFLNKGRPKERIKCVRLRGEFSHGLLIPAPDDAVLGQDLWDAFNLEWYEPELTYSTTGTFAPAPSGWGGLTKYDVDNGRQTAVRRMFKDGEDVYVTVKLNGSNCSFVFADGKMNVRSRSGFREDSDNIFWQALKNTPQVEQFCRENPDYLIYGEAYGHVKGYRYDCANGEIKFRCFDIMNKNRTFLGFDDLSDMVMKYKIPVAPSVKGESVVMKFDMSKLLELAERDCPLGNPIPEGIVVKPLIDRRYGNDRVMMKIVSNRYLMKE